METKSYSGKLIDENFKYDTLINKNQVTSSLGQPNFIDPVENKYYYYFKKKETEDKQIAELVYRKIINNVNSIISSNSLVLKNNINTTFELTSIFLISIFFGSKLKKNRDDFSILQEIMNLFISEDILRE